jgi:hypothetical protein
MTTGRVSLFKAFGNLISFYPKMSAAIAFGTMAAASRMMTRQHAANGVAQIANAVVAVPARAKAKPAPRNTRRSAVRKAQKRAPGRRKAA